MVRFSLFFISILIFPLNEEGPLIFPSSFSTDILVEAQFQEVDKSTTVTVFQLLFPIELQLHFLKRYSQQFHHSQGPQIDKIQRQNVRIEALLHCLCNIF